MPRRWAIEWPDLAATWRRKQLEYTWLRSLMGDYADFWHVTRDALVYALEKHGHEDATLVEKLMTSYRTLEAYPDATSTLAWMKHLGLKIIILSNGTQAMLTDAIAAAHLDRLVDAVLSVGAVNLYKPHPRVYQLAVDRLGMAAGAGLLRQQQRLGCGRRRALWISRGLDQSQRRSAGAPARRGGGRDQVPVRTSAVDCPRLNGIIARQQRQDR